MAKEEAKQTWLAFVDVAGVSREQSRQPGLWYIPRDCLTMEVMRTRKAAEKKRSTLYIKNPVAHRLAEQVSKRMGVTLSDAVIAALQESLRKTSRPFNRTKVDDLCARIGALPVVDARTPEEILGYDAFGIPS
jgi:antitoxin VapB